MIWERIQELVRFHSQAHNIPIEALHIADSDQTVSQFDGIQVLFVNNDAKVSTDDFRIILSYSSTESGLENVSQALEDEVRVLAG